MYIYICMYIRALQPRSWADFRSRVVGSTNPVAKSSVCSFLGPKEQGSRIVSVSIYIYNMYVCVHVSIYLLDRLDEMRLDEIRVDSINR